jgi:hypothetical protein
MEIQYVFFQGRQQDNKHNVFREIYSTVKNRLNHFIKWLREQPFFVLLPHLNFNLHWFLLFNPVAG